mmetsp:Transcript_31517/g.93958  ORF Transcript_31517/g.93958 Transcript_31517/m.93958 type:complete len:805 (-) Transcript_31517:1328-3742(-)
MSIPPPVSAADQAALNAALAAVPQCTNLVGGYCTEVPPGGKGVVLYESFRVCQEAYINLPGINLLPDWLLAVMWALFLIWLFCGVAVLSNAFIEAIEIITMAKKKVKRVDKMGNTVIREVPVWNWAVANITLLAVGSSSPEILLSIIEAVLTLDEPAGEIGPSTIIGSGAYNLFVILAVCTVALPNGVFKTVEHSRVFWWTTTWSMWAHLWLWLVYTFISPDVIDLWEAIVTLAFFPIFVYTTWLVDTRGFRWWRSQSNAVVPDDEEAAGAAAGAGKADVFHSIMHYRKDALKGSPKPSQLYNNTMTSYDLESYRDSIRANANLDPHVPKVLLLGADLAVLESTREAHVQVERIHGDAEKAILVGYTCKDVTAVRGTDYELAEGTLEFAPGETVKDIVVKIIDDDVFTPDVTFQVVLTSAMTADGGEVKILRKTTDVTIVDNDEQRTVVFELPSFEVGALDPYAEVVVVRKGGAAGNDTVRYFTKNASAAEGTHYRSSSGELAFAKGETRKVVRVPLLKFDSEDLSLGMLAFHMEICDPSSGCTLGARKECRVRIVPGAKLDAKTSKAYAEGKPAGGYDLWGEWRKKFQTAVLPDYNPEEGGLWGTLLLQYMTVTWKLLAALTPPAEWKGGWPCFSMALGLLGALMFIVKEVAEMFGCACGLSDLMTGLSIVAIGTSLPDTFGSRYAALNDPTADAAIGNIMGSNTVNVFLGLGVPWVVSAVYYEVNGTFYAVFAGSLSFSILVFFILSAIGVGILLVRRGQGGELGGSKVGQLMSAAGYITCWLAFLILVGLYDYEHIPDLGI